MEGEERGAKARAQCIGQAAARSRHEMRYVRTEGDGLQRRVFGAELAIDRVGDDGVIDAAVGERLQRGTVRGGEHEGKVALRHESQAG